MSAFLCPFFGAGAQIFTNAGVVAGGAQLYTYVAGSTSQSATWTSSAQSVQNANPLIASSSGRFSQEIWLQSGQLYKLVLTDASGNTLGTWDNIAGINDTTGSASEWIATGLTPTYGSSTSFIVPGNQTAIFTTNRRAQINVSAGTVYGSVASATYAAGATTVTLVMDGTNVIDSGISAVSLALLNPSHPSVNAAGVVWVNAGVAVNLATELAALAAALPSLPLNVANGGTGSNSLTANALLVGNNTGAIASLAPGTAGNVATSNGTGWVSQAPASSGVSSAIPSNQVFTSSGTFTVPTGITKVRVTVVGGGGGGASASGGQYAGGGGGGTAIKTITGLTPGGTVTVTVGAGGSATVTGGTSSFGSYCSATGGTGGSGTSGGAGGIGSNGDLNIQGGGGGLGGSVNGNFYASGGASFLGGGGTGGINSAGGQTNGGPYGGGGGGNAGTGANGVVYVEY